MARSYNETTLAQLKQVLSEKLTQPGGTNLAELTEAVDGVYSFADETRAGLIAKTESFRAANWANKEAWEESGVVKTLKWYTAEDDHVCPQCQALDGTVVGIEDKFFDDTYSDGDTPPRHLCADASCDELEDGSTSHVDAPPIRRSALQLLLVNSGSSSRSGDDCHLPEEIQCRPHEAALHGQLCAAFPGLASVATACRQN